MKANFSLVLAKRKSVSFMTKSHNAWAI